MKVLVLAVALVVGACTPPEVTDPAQAECDEIFSLLAMAVVHRGWQSSADGRGHNIGAVLVNESFEPVFWARNTVGRSDNATQHGEVRLIQEFLNCPAIGRYAEGFTVYTTLEPCAMCAGMMALARVGRVVYVQADPQYGNVRKALDEIEYPLLFTEHTPAALPQKKLLDAGYQAFGKANDDASVVEYLLLPDAERIFASAEKDLNRYRPRHAENARVLAHAQAFLRRVPADDDERPARFCPAG